MSRFNICRVYVSVACALLLSVTATAAHGDTSEQVRQTLQPLIDEAGKVPEQAYTPESWNTMRFALDTARQSMKSPETDSETLQQAYDDLLSNMDALVKRSEVQPDLPRVGLSASLFATNDVGPVNDVALQWAASEPCERFEVSRAENETGPYKKLYDGPGRSFNDYDLPMGEHFYRMTAYLDGGKYESNIAMVKPEPMPTGLERISNETENEKRLRKQPIKVGDVYYDYRMERDGKSLKIIQWTSADGEHWTRGSVVLDRSSHPDMADAKFEAETWFYDARHDRIVGWAHWELSGPHYGYGRAMVATAKPGEPFTIHHIYNPLGVQVRDMSIFIDEDGQGYLVAASNVPGQGANATLTLFKLNDDYIDVTGIVTKVMEGGYREAPHIIKHDGFYYLFFSQAAGWYPSRAAYVSSRLLAGPWSEPRPIANNSTFSSQAGPVIAFGEQEPHQYVMASNRWLRGAGTSSQVIMPVRFAQGFAFMDYAPHLLYNMPRNKIVPIELGELLSQDHPADTTIPASAGHGIGMAFDGDYETFFQSEQKDWPFSIGVDLGEPCMVNNVQVSWYIHKGSEAYYTYTIDGSLDAKTWTTLVDRTNTDDTVVNKTYGFTSDVLTTPARARYIRLTVQNAHLHNNPNNWYSPTIYEMKVYGEKVRQGQTR